MSWFPALLALLLHRALPAEDGQRPVVFLGDANYAPMTYLDGGIAKGVVIDILRALERRTGRRFDIRLMAWNDAQAALLRGEADALCQMSITDVRKKLYDFTEAMLESQYSIFTHADRTGLAGLGDLHGLQVAATMGGLPRQLLETEGGIGIVLMPDYPAGFAMLRDGKVDALLADRWVGTYVLAQHRIRDVRISDKPVATLASAIAVAKGHADLLAVLDVGLAGLKSDGTIARITEEWQPQDVVFLTRGHLERWITGAVVGLLALLLIVVVVWAVSLRREISVRRRTEIALRASEARFRAIFELAPIGIAIIDVPSHRLIQVNPAFCTILGRDRADLLAGDLARLSHPDDVAATVAAARQLNAGEVEHISLRKRYLRPDGAVVWTEMAAVSEGDPGQPTTRTIALVRDISSLHQAEDALRRHHENLERLVSARTGDLEQARAAAERLSESAAAANRAKSDFLASMSHEIRTPLNAVLGYAQLLARDATLVPEHQRAIAVINRSGEHLLALISDILDMARIESGHSTLDAEDFDLHDLLDNLKSLFHLRALDKGLTLRLVIAADLPRCVRTDQRKVRQILANLLSNAVKFTNTGSVDLIARHQNGELRLVVRDSGPGLGEADLARLFQPFVQIVTSGGRRDGSGLGLAISRGFAHTLGGDLTASSEVGKGSSFTLGIPVTVVARADRMIAPRQEAIALAPGTIAPRVLVVEDEPDLRDLLVTLFSETGIDVRAVGDGAEAVHSCREWQPHLVWMDLTMPVMDGLSASRAIRGLPGPQPVIIVLTAAAFNGDRPRILAAGCDAVMHKPYREDELFTQMESLLGIRFVWRRNTPEQTATATSSEDDLRSGLLTLTTQKRAALHAAVVTGDVEAMRQLVEPLSDSALRQGLLTMIERFALDCLQALLESLDDATTLGRTS